MHACCTHISKGTALTDLRVVRGALLRQKTSESILTIGLRAAETCGPVVAWPRWRVCNKLTHGSWSVEAHANTDGCPLLSWRIQKARCWLAPSTQAEQEERMADRQIYIPTPDRTRTPVFPMGPGRTTESNPLSSWDPTEKSHLPK